MKIILVLLVITSCGKIKTQNEIKGNPTVKIDIPTEHKVTYGADFIGTAKFCDERYGYKSKKSEECFNDYRDFNNANFNVGIDTNSIDTFCSKYDDSVKDDCVNELLELLKLPASL